MRMNDWHTDLGWLLLRAALAAPVILMAWLIRRDIGRDICREAPLGPPPGLS